MRWASLSCLILLCIGCTRVTIPPSYGIFLEHAHHFQNLKVQPDKTLPALLINADQGAFPSKLVVYADPGWSLNERSQRKLQRIPPNGTPMEVETRLVRLANNFYEVVPRDSFQVESVYVFQIAYSAVRAFTVK